MSDESNAKADDADYVSPAPAAAPAQEAAPTAATVPAPVTDVRIQPSLPASLPPEEVERITADLIGVLKTVYDPEIPVDIYELGLIYKVDLDDDRNLTIDMTLTAPGCPVAGEMPGWVENAAMSVEGIKDVTVNMVFDPPWGPERMSEEAQVALNWW